jgi:hypothetical protein
MKVLIALATYNRPVITHLCLQNLQSVRSDEVKLDDVVRLVDLGDGDVGAVVLDLMLAHSTLAVFCDEIGTVPVG